MQADVKLKEPPPPWVPPFRRGTRTPLTSERSTILMFSVIHSKSNTSSSLKMLTIHHQLFIKFTFFRIEGNIPIIFIVGCFWILLIMIVGNVIIRNFTVFYLGLD